jgi:hypothetical protein
MFVGAYFEECDMKAICLVVVSGGVAYAYAPAHVDCRVIDLDSLSQGDEPATLPRGIGFEHLAKQAELRIGEDFTMED